MAWKSNNPASRGKVIVGYDSMGRPRWRSVEKPLDKLMAQVEMAPNGCHIWTGRTNEAGYGVVCVDHKQTYTHRLAYELLVGPIPEGLQLDHTCHTNDESCAGGPTCAHRACCNPKHLEPVEPAENSRRGAIGRRTHCPQGHPYDAENTLTKQRAGGRRKRDCRECQRARQRRVRREATHCTNGHEFTDDNVLIRSDGVRWCRTCREAFARGQRGELNRVAKLTDLQRAEILRRVRGGEARPSIAADFGVSPTTISRIKRLAEEPEAA